MQGAGAGGWHARDPWAGHRSTCGGPQEAREKTQDGRKEQRTGVIQSGGGRAKEGPDSRALSGRRQWASGYMPRKAGVSAAENGSNSAKSPGLSLLKVLGKAESRLRGTAQGPSFALLGSHQSWRGEGAASDRAQRRRCGCEQVPGGTAHGAPGSGSACPSLLVV